MVNGKSTLFHIMLSIFLFCIVLGCVSNNPPTPTPTPQPTPTLTPIPTPQPTPTSNPQINVTMSSPTDGSTVGFKELISGSSTGVYGSSLHLYVLINPVATSDVWWVQPQANVSSDGTWNVDAQFGRSAQEDMGTKYVITSIVTSDVLPVGQTSYPSNIIASTKQIQLTRK